MDSEDVIIYTSNFQSIKLGVWGCQKSEALTSKCSPGSYVDSKWGTDYYYLSINAKTNIIFTNWLENVSSSCPTVHSPCHCQALFPRPLLAPGKSWVARTGRTARMQQLGMEVVTPHLFSSSFIPFAEKDMHSPPTCCARCVVLSSISRTAAFSCFLPALPARRL